MGRRTSKSRDDDPRRRLPAVGILCARPDALALAAQFGSAAVAREVRGLLASIRVRPLIDNSDHLSADGLITQVALRLAECTRPSLSAVINATGVVIHTNLGRAPLASEAVAAMTEAAGYANLELDLDGGRRSSRHDHLDSLIAEVTGAEAGIALNNGAGAVLAALAALAPGAGVIVSRGEMIEIGGGFRVPDIVRQGGARLIEVGATNRTHLRDYEAALREHPDARMILRTHPSNFRITGFTSAPSLADLARFARDRGLMLVEDLGGGALVDLAPFGIPGEPRVQDSLMAGVDLVMFSGDKLLGGPQAGVLAGRRDLVDRVAGHPLARALRLDKLSLAALAATLRLYRAPSDPFALVPVLRMLTQSAETLAARAEAVMALTPDLKTLDVRIVDTNGYAGGGAMPMLALPSRALALTSSVWSADSLARRLRTGPEPVVGRIAEDRVLLDMRTVTDEDPPILARAISRAACPD